MADCVSENMNIIDGYQANGLNRYPFPPPSCCPSLIAGPTGPMGPMGPVGPAIRDGQQGWLGQGKRFRPFACWPEMMFMFSEAQSAIISSSGLGKAQFTI